MKVNYNNVRKQAIYAYDKLTYRLNNSIIKEDQFAEPNDEGHCNIKGYILINPNEIHEQMESLRRLIGIMAATSIEGDEEFKDVYQEVFPNEGDTMKIFNEQSDGDGN